MLLEYGDEEDQLRKEEEERQNLMLAIRKKHQEAGVADFVRDPETPPPENTDKQATPKIEHA